MADFKEIQIGEDGQVYQVKDATARESAGSGGEGTVTAVKMNNGTPIEPDENGVVNLGTVITQHQDISGKAEKSEMSIVDGTGANADKTTITLKSGTSAVVLKQHQDISGKVDKETGKSLMSDAEHTKLEDLPSNPVQSVTLNGNTPMVDASGNVNLGNVQGQKGDKGDKGDTVVVGGEEEFSIVNDLDTGGESDALSAEMGRRLALKAGTYEQAWQRSKVITVPFCWLWVETVNGSSICKPIWHKGSSQFVDAAGGVVSAAEASAVPSAPTMTINGSAVTSDYPVGKNTELLITPASGSVLYYRLGSSGDYTASLGAVTLTLSTAGEQVISAYCKNTKGDSSTTSVTLTVGGLASPTFAANSGTTITQKTGFYEVSRGGSVRISGTQNGTLYISTDGTNYTAVEGNNYYDVDVDNATYESTALVIYAKNKVDDDYSDPLTLTLKMAALAAPTFSKASGSELAAGGETITLSGPSGATIYYTTNGDTPTSSSTQYSSGISVTTATTIKAIAVDSYGSSEVASASYTVAVDHKFQFKIKLSDNNSREYIPITGNMGATYNMTIDWGDGSAVQTYAKVGVKKELYHDYSGSAGDEFTITLRGSAIPFLDFNDTSMCNANVVTAILDNSLTCDTEFGYRFGSALASICVNAFQNNIGSSISFMNFAGSTLPDGLLSHLTKDSTLYPLTSTVYMFRGTSVAISASQMNELKAVIGHVTRWESMFNQYSGTAAIPDDFFDALPGDEDDGGRIVTTVEQWTNGAGSGLTGNAKALYDVLSTKVKANGTTTMCFKGSGLTNKNQVPTTWGGTMS